MSFQHRVSHLVEFIAHDIATLNAVYQVNHHKELPSRVLLTVQGTAFQHALLNAVSLDQLRYIHPLFSLHVQLLVTVQDGVLGDVLQVVCQRVVLQISLEV